MKSQQRILGQNRNLIPSAVITASSVRTVSNGILELPKARVGSARAVISGAYSGADEALFEVDILDTSSSTPKLISTPVFSGVGNSVISAISSTNAAESYTVTLADLGEILTASGIDMEGVALKAKTPGAASNLIHINIDRSGLIFTAQNFSLLADLEQGSGGSDNPLTGPQFDFQTKVMASDELIPADAHRISFGIDNSAIYRQWKQYKEGVWNYYFEPALIRPVPKGAVVNFVTGDVEVTITNGTWTDTYTGIVTLYDLLNAIKTDATAHTEVTGVIANDYAVGGQAVHEIKTRTDAYALPSTGSGSAFATGLIDVTVGDDAATELVTVTCIAVTAKDLAAAHVGAEIWKVEGSVSGLLTESLVTGVPFSDPDGNFGFTIPQKLPQGFSTEPKGRFTVVEISTPRSGEVDPPIICPVALSLGPEAVDQQITLTYTKRPVGCPCKDLPVPNLNTACLLGDLSTAGGNMAMGQTTITRLIAFRDWIADLLRTDIAKTVWPQTGTNQDSASTSFIGFTSSFEAALLQIDKLPEGALKTAGLVAWDKTVAEFQGDIAVGGVSLSPAVPATYTADEALTAGQSVVVVTKADGSTELTKAYGMPYNFLGTTLYTAAPAGKYGFVKDDFAAAATATVYFSGINNDLTGLTPAVFYAPGVIPGTWVPITDPANTWIQNSTNGVASSATELSIYGPSTSQLLEQRYTARLSWALMSAGIASGGADASAAVVGDGCWQDYPDEAYYWTVQGRDAYKWASTNHPYYSSIDAKNGGTYSTHEFAFQINVGCPEQLQEGDRVVMNIGNAQWPATYQVGDQQFLPMIAAQDLYFVGGKDGTNVQTWYVSGTVSGAMAAYALNTGTPAAYSSGGLTFLITPGAIPNALGDQYEFDIEVGHARWRKDAGSWTTFNVNTAATAMSDGLSVAFVLGTAPAFKAGDLYGFRSLQPYSPKQVILPNFDAWQWIGATASQVFDFGTAKTIDAVALGYHSLPSTATATIEFGTNGTTWGTPIPLAIASPVASAAFTEVSFRYARVTVASAAAAEIGYAWIGESFKPELSGEVEVRHDYKMLRGQSGLEPATQYLGTAISFTLDFTEGSISEADHAEFVAMLNAAKRGNDGALIFFPNVTRPDAWLARLNTDEVSWPDISNWRADLAYGRRLSAKLAFDGVAS